MGRRRKKGRALCGWLVVDKPSGPSSTQMVGKARRVFDAQKAGHAGTLDPAATGVLAIAFGEATKTVPYVQDGSKHYRFAIQFGSATDTDDAEGTVIATSAARPTSHQLEAILPEFVGEILQTPPQFSALKIDGQRAYDLARRGVQANIAARPLHVDRLDLVEMEEGQGLAVLEMVCGKGGYVRSMARDLGARLSIPAHCAWLRRLRTGPFSLEQAVTGQMLEPGLDDTVLLPLEAGLAALPEVTTNAQGAERISNGNPGEIVETGERSFGEAWVSHAGRACAIGQVMNGLFQPSKVFRYDD